MRIYLFERFKCKSDGKMTYCILGVQFRSEKVYMIGLRFERAFPMTWMVGDDI